MVKISSRSIVKCLYLESLAVWSGSDIFGSTRRCSRFGVLIAASAIASGLLVVIVFTANGHVCRIAATAAASLVVHQDLPGWNGTATHLIKHAMYRLCLATGEDLAVQICTFVSLENPTSVGLFFHLAHNSGA